MVLCAGYTLMGGLARAADVTAAASPSIAAVQADPDTQALLRTIEQQIVSERIALPLNDNAIETWRSVLQRQRETQNAAAYVAALEDFEKRARLLAVTEKATGKVLVAIELGIFADQAGRLAGTIPSDDPTATGHDATAAENREAQEVKSTAAASASDAAHGSAPSQSPAAAVSASEAGVPAPSASIVASTKDAVAREPPPPGASSAAASAGATDTHAPPPVRSAGVTASTDDAVTHDRSAVQAADTAPRNPAPARSTGIAASDAGTVSGAPPVEPLASPPRPPPVEPKAERTYAAAQTSLPSAERTTRDQSTRQDPSASDNARAAAAVASLPPVRSSPPAAGQPTAGQPTAQDQAMATFYAARGDEMLARKDISAARKFYEYAANAGSARAAAALARTFDAAFVAQFGVVGLKPDPASAAIWSRRAAELGGQRVDASTPGR